MNRRALMLIQYQINANIILLQYQYNIEAILSAGVQLRGGYLPP